MRAIAILLLCCLCYHADAQYVRGTYEIEGSIGKFSGNDYMMMMFGYIKDATSIGATDYYTKFKPVYAVTAKYYRTDRTAIGIAISEHSYRRAYFNVYSRYQVYYNQDAITLCFERKHTYYERNTVQLYSVASVGLFLFRAKEIHVGGVNDKPYLGVYPAFYGAPIGVRIGGKTACFAELGIGYKGLVNGGISIRIDNGDPGYRHWR